MTWNCVFNLFSRYIHSVIVPVLIFLFHKDLRKKAEVILCCWRPNSVEGSKRMAMTREQRPISAYMHQKRREWEKKQKKFMKPNQNYNIPVLFATSEGLHLRLVDDNFGPQDSNASNGQNDLLEDSLKNQWSLEPKFVMEVCDLQLPLSANRGRT